ncbi:MAG: GDCCVxC domain-containing (seleno)protein [Gallionella sp.]
MKEILSHSKLTCPACGHKERLEMPTDACRWFYECTKCKTLLKPLKGDCCVFCSYGSVACPPIQRHGKDKTTEGSCCG